MLRTKMEEAEKAEAEVEVGEQGAVVTPAGL